MREPTGTKSAAAGRETTISHLLVEAGEMAYLHVMESTTLAGVHSPAHVQQQQGGIPCQEANGPRGAGRGELGWLKGHVLKQRKGMEGRMVPCWQGLLEGLYKLRRCALQACQVLSHCVAASWHRRQVSSLPVKPCYAVRRIQTITRCLTRESRVGWC